MESRARRSPAGPPVSGLWWPGPHARPAGRPCGPAEVQTWPPARSAEVPMRNARAPGCEVKGRDVSVPGTFRPGKLACAPTLKGPCTPCEFRRLRPCDGKKNLRRNDCDRAAAGPQSVKGTRKTGPCT